MVVLTPELAGNTVAFTLVYGIIAFGITIYTVYLNYKQAKVNAQMGELLSSVRNIENILLNFEKNYHKK